MSHLNRDKKLTVSTGILLRCLAAGVLLMHDCTSTAHREHPLPKPHISGAGSVPARAAEVLLGKGMSLVVPALTAWVRDLPCLSHMFDGRGGQAGCSNVGTREMEAAHQKGSSPLGASKAET